MTDIRTLASKFVSLPVPLQVAAWSYAGEECESEVPIDEVARLFAQQGSHNKEEIVAATIAGQNWKFNLFLEKATQAFRKNCYPASDLTDARKARITRAFSIPADVPGQILETHMLVEMCHPLIQNANAFSKRMRRNSDLEQRVFRANGFSCFTPYIHVLNGLITIAMIQRLRHGGCLLSLGSGPGYLEEFLVFCGIDEKNLTLGDIVLDSISTHFSNRLAINLMDSEWPLQDCYDVVLFPESFYPALRAEMKAMGAMAGDPFHGVSWVEGWTKDEKALDAVVKLMERGYERLKAGGQMRAANLLMTEVDIPVIKQAFLRRHPEARIPFFSSTLFVVEKSICL